MAVISTPLLLLLKRVSVTLVDSRNPCGCRILVRFKRAATAPQSDTIGLSSLCLFYSEEILAIYFPQEGDCYISHIPFPSSSDIPLPTHLLNNPLRRCLNTSIIPLSLVHLCPNSLLLSPSNLPLMQKSRSQCCDDDTYRQTSHSDETFVILWRVDLLPDYKG
jgi:hypothetical protein